MWLNSRKWPGKKPGKGWELDSLKWIFSWENLLAFVILRNHCCGLIVGTTLFRKWEKAVLGTPWDPPSSNFSHCNEDWWVTGSAFCPGACTVLQELSPTVAHLVCGERMNAGGRLPDRKPNSGWPHIIWFPVCLAGPREPHALLLTQGRAGNSKGWWLPLVTALLGRCWGGMWFH